MIERFKQMTRIQLIETIAKCEAIKPEERLEAIKCIASGESPGPWPDKSCFHSEKDGICAIFPWAEEPKACTFWLSIQEALP